MFGRCRRVVRRNLLVMAIAFFLTLICTWKTLVLLSPTAVTAAEAAEPSGVSDEAAVIKEKKLTKLVVNFQDDTLQQSNEFKKNWRLLNDHNFFDIKLMKPQLDVVVQIAQELFQNFSDSSLLDFGPTTSVVPLAKGEFIYVTLINAAYVLLAENWLCNTANMSGVHERTLFIVTDQVTTWKLAKKWPRVSFHFFNLNNEASSGARSKLGDKALIWGKVGYGAFLNVRAEILARLAEAHIQLILFETDAVWLKNPELLFKNYTTFIGGDVDITIPIKGRQEKGLTLSFDPMLIVPTERSQSFLRTMSDLLNGKTERQGGRNATGPLYDQDILDELCRKQHQGLVCRTFEYADVADGPWFEMSESDRMIRLRGRTPYIVNNNFYVGIRNKINRQALHSLWFLSGYNCRYDFVHQALAKYKTQAQYEE